MISAKLKGGLGNQMFQIAAACALAWRNSDYAVFDMYSNKPKQGFQPIHYSENILSKIIWDGANYKFPNTYREKNHGYTEIPYTPGLILDGYFQSEKYFADFSKRIIDLFTHKETVDKLRKKYKLTNSISLHVRRGDYLQESASKPLPIAYYDTALGLFSNDYTIFIFSDDIGWCEDMFLDSGFNYEFIKGLTDYQEMYLMSLCNHNIIANSSFSWWGAYLNKHTKSRVIAPRTWFMGEYAYLETKDLYTDKMIII